MKWWPRSWRIQLLLVIYWPILFVSTHIPNLNLSDVHIHTTDMFLHGLAFWLLTLLYWLTFHGRLRPSLRRRPLYFCLLILGIYAALDEISQKFVHRSAGWSDWAADLIGILTALVMLYLFRRAFYWLIVCWLAFFILKHRGEWGGDEFVSGPWLQYRALFYAVSYLVLTLFFWRSLCRDNFKVSRRIIIATSITLPVYLTLDEIISVASGCRFNIAVIAGALTGIVTGILTALALARHCRLVDETYGPSLSS